MTKPKYNEDTYMVALVIGGNVLALFLMVLVLGLQFFVFPKWFAPTWCLLLVLSVGFLGANYWAFKSYFGARDLWYWLKKHN